MFKFWLKRKKKRKLLTFPNIKQIFTLEEVSDLNKYGMFPSELDAIPGTHFYNLSQIN